MYTKADAIPSLYDDSGIVHSSPTCTPNILLFLLLFLLLLSWLSPAIFLFDSTLHTLLWGLYSSVCHSGETDWSQRQDKAAHPQLGLLAFRCRNKLKLYCLTTSKHFAVKMFITKRKKNWPSCYQVSAVTSTDFNYKNCCPVRNQGLPLQGHFPQQTSVSPPLLLPPDSPHRINCSCRLLYLQVFDATAHSRVYILRVATFYLIHPYPSVFEMYLFVSF